MADNIDNIFDKALAELPTTETSAVPETQQAGDLHKEPESGTFDDSVFDKYIEPELKSAKYGSLSQQAMTGLEGAAEGVAGPLAPLAETKLGVKPEDIRARAEENPITKAIGNVAGLAGSMATGVGEGALVAKAGGAASELFKGANILSKAAQGITEFGLLQSGDEVSKMILDDPQASVQTAITDIGLSGLLGGLGGAGLGAVSPLWKATIGSKVGNLIEDFKSRMNFHLINPEPVESVTNELQNYYKNITDMADEVYGPQGLKAQDIAKSVPEMNEHISGQVQQINDKVTNAVKKMISKPNSYPERLASKLQMDLDAYQKAVSEAANPSDIFNATQEFKQTLQSYAKFDKFVKPVDEAYDFVRDAKSLAHDLRENLEDTGVWGKAAERQQAINKAFKDFLPTLKDFEKKFTTEVAGERTIDPGKVNTYVNQIGKPNAEIKQTMLRNFMEAAEKYQKVIEKSHANLGLESPVIPSALSAVKHTLAEVTPGAKLADLFVKKALTEGGGRTLGAGVGAAVGHGAGSGLVGALIGEHALGPFFSSVLPAIFKPLLSAANSAEGAKTAIDYSLSVAKGEQLLSKSMKNLFREGAEYVLADKVTPDEKDRTKLKKILKDVRNDPKMVTNNIQNMQHYLPAHGDNALQVAVNANKLLDAARPNVNKQSPLDSDIPPSPMQEAEYNRVLDVAQQPLLVLQKIKDGTILPHDIQIVQSLYPALYQRMAQKMTSEIADSVQKGQIIPYKTRLGISLFLAQPMDSTMHPQSIMSAQGQPTPVSSPTQPMQKHSEPKHSTNSLSKFSNSFKTPSQTREAARQANKG